MPSCGCAKTRNLGSSISTLESGAAGLKFTVIGPGQITGWHLSRFDSAVTPAPSAKLHGNLLCQKNRKAELTGLYTVAWADATCVRLSVRFLSEDRLEALAAVAHLAVDDCAWPMTSDADRRLTRALQSWWQARCRPVRPEQRHREPGRLQSPFRLPFLTPKRAPRPLSAWISLNTMMMRCREGGADSEEVTHLFRI